MKVIVAGGRNFKPGKFTHLELSFELGKLGVTEVVCGMAKGADMFGYEIAKSLEYSVKEFPADWKKYGKSAGFIRNGEMARYADALIVFPGGRGTANIKKQAEENGLKIIELSDRKFPMMEGDTIGNLGESC